MLRKKTATSLAIAVALVCLTICLAYGADPKHVFQFKETGYCPKCDLSGANLSNLTMASAIVPQSNLTGANLSGCKFNQFNIGMANLSGANLSGTDINTLAGRANFTNANFTGATWHGSWLIEANFTGATISGAKFPGSSFDDATWIDGTKCAKDGFNGCCKDLKTGKCKPW